MEDVVDDEGDERSANEYEQPHIEDQNEKQLPSGNRFRSENIQNKPDKKLGLETSHVPSGPMFLQKPSLI